MRPAPSGSLLQQRGGGASQQGGAGAAPSVDGEAGGGGAEEVEGVEGGVAEEGVVGEAYGGGDPGLAATLGDYGGGWPSVQCGGALSSPAWSAGCDRCRCRGLC